MTTNSTGVIAAGFLAIGIVVGAAGTIVARDGATPDMAGHEAGMAAMISMMGAGSMAGMSSMMGAGSVDHMGSMMSGDSPMSPRASMGPDASMSSDDHTSHHASPSPAVTR